MIAKLLNLTASPTTVEEDVDGANIEYTDILLSNGTFWSSPPKFSEVTSYSTSGWRKQGLLLDLSH